MAAELEGSLRWQGVQNLAKSFGVKAASRGDADASVSRQNVCIPDLRLALETALKAPESCHLEPPHKNRHARDPLLHDCSKRLANGTDGAAFRNLEKRPRDGRKQMSMFVRVDVCDVDAGVLKLFYLRESLTFDIVPTDLAAQQSLDEVEERGAKGLAIRPKKGWDALRRRRWNPIRKDNMTTHAERRMSERNSDGIFETQLRWPLAWRR